MGTTAPQNAKRELGMKQTHWPGGLMGKRFMMFVDNFPGRTNSRDRTDERKVCPEYDSMANTMQPFSLPLMF